MAEENTQAQNGQKFILVFNGEQKEFESVEEAVAWLMALSM